MRARPKIDKTQKNKDTSNTAFYTTKTSQSRCGRKYTKLVKADTSKVLTREDILRMMLKSNEKEKNKRLYIGDII